VASYLKGTHWDSALQDCSSRSAYLREPNDGTREYETVTSHECELYNRQGDGELEDDQDSLAGIGGEGTGQVPEAAEEYESKSRSRRVEYICRSFGGIPPAALRNGGSPAVCLLRSLGR